MQVLVFTSELNEPHQCMEWHMLCSSAMVSAFPLPSPEGIDVGNLEDRPEFIYPDGSNTQRVGWDVGSNCEYHNAGNGSVMSGSAYACLQAPQFMSKTSSCSTSRARRVKA